MNNFLGKDGFHWWYGVVEDNADPLKAGRVRVRIFGYHTDNLQELPTKDLPWAQPSLSPSNSKTFSPPRLGDYVMGFFSDGDSAQAPVIMGVFPGFETSYDKSKGFSPQSNLVPAQPPAGQIQYQVGQPTLAPLARGQVANTAISQANDNLSHVCDFVSDMQKNINLKKYTKAIAQQIRKAIRAVLRALGFGDVTGEGSLILNTLKAIARELKYINKEILQPILDFQKYVIAYVARLRAMVQWILSLPAKFAALLKDCLARLLKLIGAVFTDIGAGLKDGFSENSGDFDKVIKEAKDLVGAAQNTIKLTAATVVGTAQIATAATAGLLVPVSQAELEAANKVISTYEAPATPPAQNKSAP